MDRNRILIGLILSQLSFIQASSTPININNHSRCTLERQFQDSKNITLEMPQTISPNSSGQGTYVFQSGWLTNPHLSAQVGYLVTCGVSRSSLTIDFAIEENSQGSLEKYARIDTSCPDLVVFPGKRVPLHEQNLEITIYDQNNEDVVLKTTEELD